ncbi:MAG: hypothetical protein CM15mV98_320 [uncultured marine virus]|nr:MAG: hypothetical protein CM15mV98_320 [uncultured marine virus]
MENEVGGKKFWEKEFAEKDKAVLEKKRGEKEGKKGKNLKTERVQKKKAKMR